MEKQLMDKIRHHTLDDVDKAMILARLRVVHSEVEDILDELNKSLEKLHKLCSDKKDEMALLDFRFVLACDDKIIHNDDEDDKHDGLRPEIRNGCGAVTNPPSLFNFYFTSWPSSLSD